MGDTRLTLDHMRRMNIVMLFSTVTLILLFVSTSKSEELAQKELTEDDAVCNDGSQAVFYHSQTAKDPRRFVIFLEGGFFCYSPSDCIHRCTIDSPHLCTDKQEDTVDLGGILSDVDSVNKALASAYKVFIPYCTSDMFIGDCEASNDTAHYHFRGKRVFTAVVNSLKRNTDLDHASEVILAGCSAGGRGAAFNCHYLQGLLPEVQVKCVIDAAIFYPVITPFTDDCPKFNDVIAEANAYWRGDVTDFDVDTWWRTFNLPLFIGIQMFDTYGLYYYCGDSKNPDHMDAWGRGMIEISKQLAEERPDIGLFVPACADHSMVYLDAWYSHVQVGEEKLTYGEAIANWLSQTPPYQVWDDCESGSRCNQKCPGSDNHDEL